MASERIQLYSLATPNGMKVGNFLPAWLLQWPDPILAEMICNLADYSDEFWFFRSEMY